MVDWQCTTTGNKQTAKRRERKARKWREKYGIIAPDGCSAISQAQAPRTKDQLTKGPNDRPPVKSRTWRHLDTGTWVPPSRSFRERVGSHQWPGEWPVVVYYPQSVRKLGLSILMVLDGGSSLLHFIFEFAEIDMDTVQIKFTFNFKCQATALLKRNEKAL